MFFLFKNKGQMTVMILNRTADKMAACGENLSAIKPKRHIIITTKKPHTSDKRDCKVARCCGEKFFCKRAVPLAVIGP